MKRSVTVDGNVTWLTKRGIRMGFWKIGIWKGKGRKSRNRKRVDDWVEYTLNKVDCALAQGVQPQHEPLWNMFLRDFQLAFTDTTKVQSTHQKLLNLKMKPGDLDSYISSFEHLHTHAG